MTSDAGTLFTGGAVFDGHRHRGRGWVLVVDEQIVETGPEGRSPRHPAADQAQVVDLAGGLIAPGFVDAHVHAVQGGLERLRCDLSEVESRDAYLRVIADYAATHPEAPWIVGGGWALSAFPGGRALAADLDRVVPDRPVFLLNRDHHGAWVNSRALELAGLDRRTPDPVDGHLDRDADGTPTGTLHEGASDLVGRLTPRTSEEEYYAGLLEGQRYLHAHGITGWQDAIVGNFAGLDDPGPTYLRGAERGDLTARVVGALWWERDRGAEQIPELVDRRHRYTHGNMRATSVKIMQDGIMENFTAGLTAPYLDRCGHTTDNSGRSFIPADRLKEYVAALAAEDFQVHVHAIGDRGVREALDALAHARAQHGDRDLRHHLAHLQLVHPDDVPRFAELGVAANLQAFWACRDDQMVELTLPFLGEERAAWQYPFGDLHRAGARLVMGSDWPVSSPDPLAAMHVAVNRSEWDTDMSPFLPEQALDLSTAFAAYTSGSAWVNRDPFAGTIGPGLRADLAVLDRDPFAGSPAEIGAARVVSTWVGGRRVSTA